MFFDNRYRDNTPLTRIGSLPVYCTTVIVALMVAGLITSGLLGTMTMVDIFAFKPALAWKSAHLWRFVSYVGVNEPNFFSLFGLLFTYSFGRDCEVELGRQRYLGFLALLIVVPALVVSLFWLLGLTGMLAGSLTLSMGLVIAFATMYPNVEVWGSIPMKYLAMASVFIAAIGELQNGSQLSLIGMLATCAGSYGYIRAMRSGVLEGFSLSRFFERKPKLRVVPGPTQQVKVRPVRNEAEVDVDVLLDKIARTGMSSLTEKEKARLQQAREELMRREKR